MAKETSRDVVGKANPWWPLPCSQSALTAPLRATESSFNRVKRTFCRRAKSKLEPGKSKLRAPLAKTGRAGRDGPQSNHTFRGRHRPAGLRPSRDTNPCGKLSRAGRSVVRKAVRGSPPLH